MAIDLKLDGLSTAEKLQLLEKIWDDLCHESGDVRSPEWHGAVLAQRKRELDAGTMPISSWVEAKERLSKLGK